MLNPRLRSKIRVIVGSIYSTSPCQCANTEIKTQVLWSPRKMSLGIIPNEHQHSAEASMVEIEDQFMDSEFWSPICDKASCRLSGHVIHSYQRIPMQLMSMHHMWTNKKYAIYCRLPILYEMEAIMVEYIEESQEPNAATKVISQVLPRSKFLKASGIVSAALKINGKSTI